jgi:predicted dinucleotide-binding enzyme
MRIAIVGAGRIGGNAARSWSRAGHDVSISSGDSAAERIVSTLIADAGFAAVDLGSNADAAVMEAPRRPGSVYGEEYRLPEARAVAEGVPRGEEIPPTPHY